MRGAKQLVWLRLFNQRSNFLQRSAHNPEQTVVHRRAAIMRRKTLAAIFLMASTTAICFAQTQTAVLIDTNKPHLYLAFERLENDLVWLRLQNNSRWAINVETENPGSALMRLQLTDGRMVNALADRAIVSPDYFIAQPDSVGAAQYSCTSSSSWIPPSSSILFTVPLKDFRLASQLSIRFSYEWETGLGAVEHRVNLSEGTLKTMLQARTP